MKNQFRSIGVKGTKRRIIAVRNPFAIVQSVDSDPVCPGGDVRCPQHQSVVGRYRQKVCIKRCRLLFPSGFFRARRLDSPSDHQKHAAKQRFHNRISVCAAFHHPSPSVLLLLNYSSPPIVKYEVKINLKSRQKATGFGNRCANLGGRLKLWRKTPKGCSSRWSFGERDGRDGQFPKGCGGSTISGDLREQKSIGAMASSPNTWASPKIFCLMPLTVTVKSTDHT